MLDGFPCAGIHIDVWKYLCTKVSACSRGSSICNAQATVGRETEPCLLHGVSGLIRRYRHLRHVLAFSKHAEEVAANSNYVMQ